MDLFPYSDSDSDSADEAVEASDVASEAASTRTALPSALEALSNVDAPTFLYAGQPTATDKKYFNLGFDPAGSSQQSKASKSLVLPSAGPVSSSASALSPPIESEPPIADESSSKPDRSQLSQRERNRKQEQRGQATFTLKDGRDMPDLYRPSSGVGADPASVVQQAARGGRAQKRPTDLLSEGISGATATKDKKARAGQMRKVASGQSFEGRTWKSEAEMVMRQQYD
jgi:hypothetical protein